MGSSNSSSSCTSQSSSACTSQSSSEHGHTESHDITDLDAEIKALRTEIVEYSLMSPPPSPTTQFMLPNNLGTTLMARFEQTGQVRDLDEAISFHREALELQLPTLSNSCRVTSLDNLAIALLTRFGQGGQKMDLDEAISLCQQALEIPLPDHSEDRCTLLNNFASALTTRFGQTNSGSYASRKEDLDKAILHRREVLKLVPPPHPHRVTSLNNLSRSLHIRFKDENPLMQEKSILKAFEVVLPSPDRQSVSLEDLASRRNTHFDIGGESQRDLDEIISLQREALKLLDPSDHDRRCSLIDHLASALETQFDIGGGEDNLYEAIGLLRDALKFRTATHPLQSNTFCLLGRLWITIYSRGERIRGMPRDLEEAMSSFSAATQCPSQSPSHRLSMAGIWIGQAVKYEHYSAFRAYGVAMQTLPQVAALSLDVQSRQEALNAGTDGLARQAARYAIDVAANEKAVEYLEAGRSIFWSQALSLHSPFSQLHDIAPELEKKLQELATALEQGSYRDASSEGFNNRTKLAVEQETSRLNRINEEWLESLEKVRALKGFEDFLKPAQFSSLRSAASRHPIVMLVAGFDTSHCLIMTSTILHCIPLPTLSLPHLNTLVRLVQEAISPLMSSRSLSAEETLQGLDEHLGGERKSKEYRGNLKRANLKSSDDIFILVLRVLWDRLVKPVIDFLDIKKSSGILPVVQWCPTGPFAFLPIHAAGCYDDKLAIECASDYFISSYTPTIGALLADDPHPSPKNFKMMAVIQSDELPYAKRELEKILQHISDDKLIKFGTTEAPANVAAVASALSQASIVHFACHGTQDSSKPLKSGLKLQDGMLELPRIMKEKIAHGSLAFLSACETATGHEDLADEAMSLGACLLYSGFQRVVATMWEIIDNDGPTVADAFYEELFRGPDGKPALEPDVTKSARALDIAVKKLRSQNVSFRRWVPFIHMGK